jgi:hypothetical protein
VVKLIFEEEYMRKMILGMFFCVSVFLAMLGTVAADDGRAFTAALSGAGAVPPVTTMAKGDALFQLSKDGSTLSYKLNVADLENVTAAHIHQGKEGKNGPPVAFLFAGPRKEGKFTGMLAEGAITSDKLITTLKGKSVKDLVTMIEAGDAYVNVHSVQYPDGEIRGQIK